MAECRTFFKKCWSNDSEVGTMPVRIGKGGRLIIIHAGKSQVFLPTVSIYLNQNDVYHEEINHNKLKT